MGDKITDLALEAYTGKQLSSAERQQMSRSLPDAEHQKRHAYFRDLAAQEKSGKALTDAERQWMDQARSAAAQHTTMGPRGRGSAPASVPAPVFQGAHADAQTIDNKSQFGKVEEYDPNTQSPLGHYASGVGSLPSSPGWDAFKRGAAGVAPPVPSPMPNAPVEVPLDKKALRTDERGRAIIDLPSGPIGTDEAGRAKDVRGNTLGQIDNETDTYRQLDRRPSDVTMQDTDKFGSDQLQRMYGPHLKAVDENEGKYPSGYFQGMTPEKKTNIKAGVMELLRRRKGQRI